MINHDSDIPYRCQLLYAGAKLTNGDRDAEYGSPVGNMQDIARLWQAYLIGAGHMEENNRVDRLTGEDVAHMMTLMKIARTYANAKADTYIDSATYQGIAGECAKEERNSGE